MDIYIYMYKYIYVYIYIYIYTHISITSKENARAPIVGKTNVTGVIFCRRFSGCIIYRQWF